MPGPLVSVVIPVYNAERFLAEAVESVFAQSCPDWELLLVDDGSTDGSVEHCKRYAATNPDRVRYLEHDSHRNRGASASRNLGVKNARGDYVAFLDADDIWLPKKLEEQVAILESHPDASMLYAATEYWYSWSGDPADAARDWVWRGYGVPTDTVISPPAVLTAFLKNGSTVPCTGSLLIRRAAFDRVGGYEEAFTHIYTDQAFYARFCLREPVVVADQCWDRYRQHGESSCQVVEKRGQADASRLSYLTWLETYLRGQGVSKDSELWAALQSALRPFRPNALDRIRTVRNLAARALKSVARRALPDASQRWIQRRRLGEAYVPPVGRVRFGDLRRVSPVSHEWGFGRGLPIDRHYVESFLQRHADDVRGRVLEVKDSSYTRRFGQDRVTHRDVVDVNKDNSEATIIADLSQGDRIPSNTFDCIIFTQTLLLIYDFRSAVATLHRILKPGGVLLATLPSISKIARDDKGQWQDFWRFTDMSARRLFGEFFPAEALQVESHGNVLAATAFLHGLSAHELDVEELAYRDPDFQVTVTIRAQKAVRE